MGNTIKKLGCCRLCRSADFDVLFEKYGYEVAKCRSCGFIFLNFSPSTDFIQNYYSEDFFKDPGIKHGFSDYEAEVDNLNKTFLERIDVLRKYKPKGFLLDIGCATGTFMEVAGKFWKVYGIEVSEYASRIARQKNLEVFQGTLDQLPFGNQKFDVITLWDTLEHLSEPSETIRRLREITDPGAIVAVTTGDVSSLVSKISARFWHLYNIPQHLSFFDKRSITDLFGKCGFEVREINYPSVNFSLDYLLFRLFTFYKIKWLLPFYNFLKGKGWLNFSIRVNLFDIMFVIAQRK